jgi:hypothetical protein
LSVSSKIATDKKEGWIDLIEQPCRTSGNQELGHLEAVGGEFIVIRKVYLAIHTHYYYIPYDKVQGWEGNIIWLGITRAEVEQQYEKHKAPDPKQYYVKGDTLTVPLHTQKLYSSHPKVRNKYSLQQICT